MSLPFFKKLFSGNNASSDVTAETKREKQTDTDKQNEATESVRIKKPWIGVDLDGTLAHYNGWRGLQHIGKPIPLMLERIRQWQANGFTIKIMTARASVPGGVPPVEAWLKKYGLEGVEVTNMKDFDMVELWDDRAIQVIENTGKAVLRGNYIGMPRAPLLQQEAINETAEQGNL